MGVENPKALMPGIELQVEDPDQWTHLEVLLTNADRGDLTAAARKFVPPATWAVVGVFNGGLLWTSLVLSVDHEGGLTPVSMLEHSLAETRGSLTEAAREAVAWVQTRFGHCSLGFFVQKTHAETILGASDKAAAIRAASAAGGLILSPVPPALALALA